MEMTIIDKIRKSCLDVFNGNISLMSDFWLITEKKKLFIKRKKSCCLGRWRQKH